MLLHQVQSNYYTPKKPDIKVWMEYKCEWYIFKHVGSVQKLAVHKHEQNVKSLPKIKQYTLHKCTQAYRSIAI